jgi:outer membrane protein assembly factor BamA
MLSDPVSRQSPFAPLVADGALRNIKDHGDTTQRFRQEIYVSDAI